MAFKIELPHVGESVTEAVIGKWLKSPGEHVEKYDPLVEVITDKVSMDIPAPASGTLTKLLAAEGDTVPMGSVIAEMETDEVIVQGESELSTTPPGADSPGSSLAGRIGTLVQGANVGPTGGEFLDTSLSSSTDDALPATAEVSRPNDGKQRSPTIAATSDEMLTAGVSSCTISTFPVRDTDSAIASASRGRSVRRSSTSTSNPCSEAVSAACSA